MSFALNSTKTFAAVDLPASLKPGDPNVFWCTDKPGSQVVARTFRENKAADKQISGDAKTVDWESFGLGALGGAALAGIIWALSSHH